MADLTDSKLTLMEALAGGHCANYLADEVLGTIGCSWGGWEAEVHLEDAPVGLRVPRSLKRWLQQPRTP